VNPVLDRFTSLLDQARRALLLVWATSRGLFLGLVLATLIGSLSWIGFSMADDATALIEKLVAQHGPLMFHQSGGCCDGSAPMCYPRGEFRVGITGGVRR